MIKKILPLVCCCFVFIDIHYALANTPDCNVAFETCKTNCTQHQIYDRERGGNVTRTDFISLCQSSCQEGFQWCLRQDSTMSCKTFAYHCQSQCPWSIDDYTQEKILHSDSFRQCEASCSAGAAACEPFRKSLPPRQRSGVFDVCPEAQTACYTDCVLEIKDMKKDFSIADTNYPDKCAEACAQGISQCRASSGAAACDAYEQPCAKFCPSSIESSGVSKSDPQVQQWCRNSCAVGRAYCRSLQNLALDRTTAAAVSLPPVASSTPVVPPKTPGKSLLSNLISKMQPTKATNDKSNQFNITHCANAEQYCKEDCRKNKIILVMEGMWPQRYSNQAETDFWQQCEDACTRAKSACLTGQGFKVPCQKECPRAYHDKTGNTYPQNDAQNRCEWSCTIGQDAYNGNENKNICELGYDDCEGQCDDSSDMQGGDAFYQTCTEACKAGEAQCPNALIGNYCQDFYQSCTDKCPQSFSDDDAGADCRMACGVGAKKCQERADIRYD